MLFHFIINNMNNAQEEVYDINNVQLKNSAFQNNQKF